MKTENSGIVHIVLFRWNEDATPEAIAAAVEALRGLKDTVPNILDLSVGENFSDRAKGYHHALVVRFPDRAALEAYGPHPGHQYVVQNFTNPIRADVLAFDYEI